LSSSASNAVKNAASAGERRGISSRRDNGAESTGRCQRVIWSTVCNVPTGVLRVARRKIFLAFGVVNVRVVAVCDWAVCGVGEVVGFASPVDLPPTWASVRYVSDLAVEVALCKEVACGLALMSFTRCGPPCNCEASDLSMPGMWEGSPSYAFWIAVIRFLSPR